MKVERGVAAIGGTALLVAWIAVAADLARGPRVVVAEREQPRELTRAERIAADIESQSARLHARLASAPLPSPEGRDPFRFNDRAPRAMTRVAAAAVRDDAASRPDAAGSVEPVAPVATVPLTLSGIAEDTSADGTIRTAVLSGLGDVFLVKAGDVIASRFQIVAVGADAVEILDTTSGATVRLGLR